MLVQLTDAPFRILQRWCGAAVMPYIFIFPNLLFFGVFVALPLLVNLAFSFTGGTNLFLADRVYTGTEQYDYLMECSSYLDWTSCREDRFWRGIFNTGIFVFFQVSLLVFFSLITALVLNRKIIGRGFFRSVFFFPAPLIPLDLSYDQRVINGAQAANYDALSPATR